MTDRTITITDRAHEQILELRAAEDDGDGLGLRIEVTGVRGADFTYDLAFEPLAEADDDDHRYDDRGLTVVIPADSVANLRGATLDLPSASGQGGLVLRNPNRPETPQLGDAIELTRHARGEGAPAARPAGQPGPRRPRRLRHAGEGRGLGRPRLDGRRLPGLRRVGA